MKLSVAEIAFIVFSIIIIVITIHEYAGRRIGPCRILDTENYVYSVMPNAPCHLKIYYNPEAKRDVYVIPLIYDKKPKSRNDKWKEMSSLVKYVARSNITGSPTHICAYSGRYCRIQHGELIFIDQPEDISNTRINSNQ